MFLFVLALIPIGFYALMSFKFNKDYDIINLYIIEIIIVLILSTIAQFYFYKTYNLNLLPSQSQVSSNFWFAFSFPLVFFIGGYIREKITKKDGLSFKGATAMFLALFLIFAWLIPLGQKYDYTKRLDTMEEVFVSQDVDKFQVEDDIMIAFTYSGHDRFTRPRRRYSVSYNNFFYLRNNSDALYTGDIYFNLYDENNELTDKKIVENITLEPGDTQLLVIEEENPTLDDEWDKHSFKSDKEIHTFEAQILFE